MRAYIFGFGALFVSVLAACGGAGESGSGGGGGSGGGTSTATSTGGASACDDTSSDPDNCGACGHACGGGACVEGACQPVVLADGLAGPRSLAIDDANAYWALAGKSDLWRLPLSGGSPTVVLTDPDGALVSLAVDAADLYWITPGKLAKAPKAGGAPVTLEQSGFGHDRLALGATHAFVAMGAGSFLSMVMQYPLDGGAEVQVGDNLVSASSIGQIAVDHTNLVWLEHKAGESAVSMIPLSVAAACSTLCWKDQMKLLASGEAPAGSEAGGIIADDTRVYWIAGDAIRAVPAAGGDVTSLVTGLSAPMGLAIDATHLYVTDRGAGAVIRVPLAGGEPETIAADQGSVRDVRVDERAVYWTTDDEAGGAVMKLVK